MRATVLDAYASLRRTHPDRRFVYGETGWPGGGPFWPHRTHRNGLSVDFMVPVLNDAGRSVPLPCSPLTLWGYGIEFDPRGRAAWLRIDFEALAAHLGALRQAAERHGLRLGRVILAPEFAARLAGTPSGRGLAAAVPFFTGRPWVRHDEHYHVDLEIE